MSELILYAFNKYNKCLLFFLARTITSIANFLFGVLLFILDSTYGSFWKIDWKINTAPKNIHFPLSKLRLESWINSQTKSKPHLMQNSDHSAWELNHFWIVLLCRNSNNIIVYVKPMNAIIFNLDINEANKNKHFHYSTEKLNTR